MPFARQTTLIGMMGCKYATVPYIDLTSGKEVPEPLWECL